jgi:hypothetical protein
LAAREDETVEALAEELGDELAEELEEELEEEFEEELEQGFREEVERAVLDSLTEASNALTKAEIAITAALGSVAETERQLTDAHAAGSKALEHVVFAWNGVGELIQNEEPERGAAAIFETSQNGAPEDVDESGSSADYKKPRAPESGIVAEARAVERQARALADAQTSKGNPTE